MLKPCLSIKLKHLEINSVINWLRTAIYLYKIFVGNRIFTHTYCIIPINSTDPINNVGKIGTYSQNLINNFAVSQRLLIK